jgi:hypothetical protein
VPNLILRGFSSSGAMRATGRPPRATMVVLPLAASFISLENCALAYAMLSFFVGMAASRSSETWMTETMEAALRPTLAVWSSLVK